jgi:hypothetical protein
MNTDIKEMEEKFILRSEQRVRVYREFKDSKFEVCFCIPSKPRKSREKNSTVKI